jgi:hypothetical protein
VIYGNITYRNSLAKKMNIKAGLLAFKKGNFCLKHKNYEVIFNGASRVCGEKN